MNVPKLRFGEFADEWDIKLINDITSKVGSGSTPSGGSQVYTDKGILFIRSQNINNDQLIFDDTTYISQSIHDKMKGSTVQANDVLLNITGASIGRSCVVPENFIVGNVNQHVSIIRFIDGYVPRFYQKYLSSERGQKHISSLQVGSGREGLNFQAIRKIAIPSPDMNEQQKIADFLSAVDEKNTALTAQKTALTQYKQGMMQRIFNQTLRFKDDNSADYPEWEEMRLGDIGTFIGGGTPSKGKEYYWNGSIPWISSSDISDDIHSIRIERYISDIGLQESATKLVPANSILIVSRVGVGKVAVNKTPLCTSQDFTNLIPTHNNHSIFFAYLLKHLTEKLLSFNQGTSIKGFVKSDLELMEISRPCLIEQKKIAQFLTELDDKINAVNAQIQFGQQWKQGLLQQMFV